MRNFLFKSCKITASLITLLASPLSFSGTVGDAPVSTPHYLVSLGGGIAFHMGYRSSQYFPILDPITDEFYYYRGSAKKNNGVIDAFIGREWTVKPQLLAQLGIGYNQLFNSRIRGTYLQGVDIFSTDTFSYKYKAQLRQVLVEGKLLHAYSPTVLPYVLVGLGVSVNDANDFQEYFPPFLTFTRQYGNHHEEVSFSYTLGLGIDKQITEHVRLGVGYRFADYGRTNLGTARIDFIPVPGTLSQQHVYTNVVLGQITWVQ